MCRPYWPHGDRGNCPNPLQCNGFGQFIYYMIHPSRIPAIAAFAFISSLCTISTLVVWPNRPLRHKTAPTVSMLSATGRPRGFAGCGGFPWGSRRGRGRPFMSSRCKKILQTIRKAFNINGSGLSGRCYDAPTRFR